ncbi:hypothetical protein AAMO2058_000426100 [Amorphochlora amoebiformis]
MIPDSNNPKNKSRKKLVIFRCHKSRISSHVWQRMGLCCSGRRAPVRKFEPETDEDGALKILFNLVDADHSGAIDKKEVLTKLGKQKDSEGRQHLIGLLNNVTVEADDGLIREPDWKKAMGKIKRSMETQAQFCDYLKQMHLTASLSNHSFHMKPSKREEVKGSGGE